MLFNGPVGDAMKQAAATRLPQVIFVGSTSDQRRFAAWNAMNHYDQNAVISVITKGSAEEAQLDAVVAERGIVPRVHIFPPAGRGLTPTCLHSKGFTEAVIAQAIATAGGVMMSYSDVMDSISKGFIDKEVRNANQEAQRALARALAGGVAAASASPPVNGLSASGLTSPAAASSAVASSVASPAAPAPSAASPAPSPKPLATPTAPTAPAVANPLPNVKVSLRVADGKAHAVYTNNLWNAATQLAKGQRFVLEVGRTDNPRRAATIEEMHALPIVEGTVVRLNLNPVTDLSSSSSAAARPTSPPAPAPAPAAAAVAPAATSSSAAPSGSVEIRFTLPTGANHQLAFAPSTTLGEVRAKVAASFLEGSAEMAAYCTANGLSQTDFSLVVAYPPKRLEGTEEMNAKTIAELNLGAKFALRVVMAFVGGVPPAAGQQPQGTVTGSISGLMGRMGGWLRPNAAAPQDEDDSAK